MKFTCKVEIEAPRSKVVALFKDPSNYKEWQDNFERYILLKGEQGKVDTMAKLVYNTPKRNKTMELIETIIINNLPNEFKAEYAHMHMINTMHNKFAELDENTTRWTADIHYSKINGFIPKIMTFLFPGMFKAQTQKWLDQFKEFVERS
jgi:hypothetical protein